MVVCSCSAGLTDEMMMLLLPSLRICDRASLLAPSPTESIATTLPTPKTTPSIVRNERSLCSRRFSMPSQMFRTILVCFIASVLDQTCKGDRMRRPYSCRRATIGSTLAAFIAG